MSKDQTNTEQQRKTIDTLKENYIRRVDEVDSFSKRFTTMCTEINTEFLYGWLNIAQHCLDLQKKYSGQYPWWYSSDLATKVVKQNTEAWIQTVQNIDSICIDSMKNMKNNMVGENKSVTQCIQNMERFYDIYKNNNNASQNYDRDETSENPKSQTKSIDPKK